MQAILILAHKNMPQVIELSKVLNEDFEIYVHIDKKVKLNQKDKSALDSLNVHYISTQEVHWGAWSIVQATIDLIKESLKNDQITNFHLISGQDWPVQNPRKIYNFFENNHNLYVSNYPVDNVKKSGEPLIDWQKFYFYYDKIDRKTTYGKIYHRISLVLQTLCRVNKLKDLGIDLELYTGSQWFDLPRDAVEYLINYLEEEPNLVKMFQTGFCSDEFWVPTILNNNTHFSNRIISNNYRYIDWRHRNNSYPAILDETDYNKVMKSDTFFMRKVEFPVSKVLIQKVRNKWDNKYE